MIIKQIHYSISPEIFALFPAYVRILVVATDINNIDRCPDLLNMLRAAEDELAGIPLNSLLSSPKIVAWQEAFRKTGTKLSEFRPAHEALARRAIRGKLLPDINTAVNIGNILSLRYQLPVGVHPLDSVGNRLELRRACGNEVFLALGSQKQETPNFGEIVFADANHVLSRCWVWRQAQCSVTLPTTRAIVINLDGLPPANQQEIQMAAVEAKEMVQRFCGGQINCYTLCSRIPSISFQIQSN